MKTRTLLTYVTLMLSILAMAVVGLPHHHHDDVICLAGDVETNGSHQGRDCSSFCSASFNFYKHPRKDIDSPRQVMPLSAVIRSWLPLVAPDDGVQTTVTDCFVESLHSLFISTSKGLRSPPCLF